MSKCPERIFSGKTEAALRQSRDGKEKLLARFGGEMPTSILKHDRSDKAIDLMVDKRSYSSMTKPGNVDRLKHVFKVSGQSCRGKDAALSRFPQSVGRKLLNLYTEVGQTVVDPFAGHNSRMELCWRAGRNYYGNDLSHEFMQANRQIRDILFNEKQNDMFPDTYSNTQIILEEGDSRNLSFDSEIGDFTITSPPYHDLEFYGNEPEQLGNYKRYEDFLTALGGVAEENFRCLKSGAFCVWCVNDFRKNGIFYDYHCHVIEILTNVGFIRHDMAIIDIGRSVRESFQNQIFEQKLLPKCHEYGIIMRKP